MTLDKIVIDDYEARFREYEDKVNNLAADLLEERSQRREVSEALVRVTEERDELARTLELEREHHKGVREYAVARQAERDEARDEVVRLGRERDEALADVDRLDDVLGEARQQIIRDAKELVRLRTIIVELGAGEAAEPEEQIEALRQEQGETE